MMTKSGNWIVAVGSSESVGTNEQNVCVCVLELKLDVKLTLHNMCLS